MSQLKISLSKAAVGVIALIFLGGCDRGYTREIVIDKHTFHVPEKYLVKGSISWLPASQHEGLHFYINPDAIPQEQMLVGLESAQRTCHPKTSPISNMLSSACAGAEVNKSEESTDAFTPEKVHQEGDPTQWAYRVKDAEGNYSTVATCFAPSDGEEGLCRSLRSYKELVYSVGLRERKIQDLPEIWAKVHQMLNLWEIQ